MKSRNTFANWYSTRTRSWHAAWMKTTRPSTILQRHVDWQKRTPQRPMPTLRLNFHPTASAAMRLSEVPTSCRPSLSPRKTASSPTNEPWNKRRAQWKSPIVRSEEHTSELQSLMRLSSDVLCLQTKTKLQTTKHQE